MSYMEKTKFTKVYVSERLPIEKGQYTVQRKDSENYHEIYWYDGSPLNESFWTAYIDFWLEESPNREEEMIQMLEKVEDKLNDFHNDLAKSVIDMEVYNPLSSDLLKIKSLIQSLKQEK